MQDTNGLLEHCCLLEREEAQILSLGGIWGGEWQDLMLNATIVSNSLLVVLVLVLAIRTGIKRFANRKITMLPKFNPIVHSISTTLSITEIMGLYYNPKLACTKLSRLIARLDLLLEIGETLAFEEYIKHAHSPRLPKVSSRQSITRDLVNTTLNTACYVYGLLAAKCFLCCSNFWYLGVVVFFPADWQLENRIIGPRLIDISHSSININYFGKVWCTVHVHPLIVCFSGLVVSRALQPWK